MVLDTSLQTPGAIARKEHDKDNSAKRVNVVAGNISLNASDLQIGGVEIKNKDTDDRVEVDTNNAIKTKLSNGGTDISTSNQLPVSLARNDLGYDAWGRPKLIYDRSIFHSLFTYDIPQVFWKEELNGNESLALNNATSVNGSLQLQGVTGGDIVTLRSKRHPRYQPNRGHLYSAALWFPTQSEANTIRNFGLAGNGCGIFFRWNETEGKMYAVRVRLGVEVNTAEITLPPGFDATKGHLYDIQFQWRGVGDYFFYIDKELIYTDSNLGMRDDTTLPTISNPAIPAFFQVIGNAKLRCGCVDITSEGGTEASLNYRSIATPVNITEIEINNDNQDGEAIMAIRVPLTYKGRANTRDAILNRVTTFVKDEATTAVWATRDPSILGGIAENTDPFLGWANVAADSPFQFMYGGHNSLLETTFENNKVYDLADLANNNVIKLIAIREEIDRPNKIINPNPQAAPFYITPGDYIIVTIRPDGDAKASGCTMEWAEEI